jgi:hypothetical protein
LRPPWVWERTITIFRVHQPDFDHEFIAWFEGGADGQRGYVDFFEYVMSFNTTVASIPLNGFISRLIWTGSPQSVISDLVSCGINASNVPMEAAVIDDADLSITYSGGWSKMQGVQYYSQSETVTTTPGSWFTIEFVGTGIWCVELIMEQLQRVLKGAGITPIRTMVARVLRLRLMAQPHRASKRPRQALFRGGSFGRMRTSPQGSTR